MLLLLLSTVVSFSFIRIRIIPYAIVFNIVRPLGTMSRLHACIERQSSGIRENTEYGEKKKGKKKAIGPRHLGHLDLHVIRHITLPPLL